VSGWTNGSVHDVAFVVHPKRAGERHCILPVTIDGLGCLYKNETDSNSPAPTGAKLLSYYPNELALMPLLAAGLWSLPVPKERLERYPNRIVGFRCKLRIVGRAMTGYRPRDAHNFEYSPGPYEVGRFESCELWEPTPPKAP